MGGNWGGFPILPVKRKSNAHIFACLSLTRHTDYGMRGWNQRETVKEKIFTQLEISSAPAINFLNNGPLLNITEDKDPGVCIVSPGISLRVICFR